MSAGEQDWTYYFKEKQEPIHQNDLKEQTARVALLRRWRPECPVGGLEVYIFALYRDNTVRKTRPT